LVESHHTPRRPRMSARACRMPNPDRLPAAKSRPFSRWSPNAAKVGKPASELTPDLQLLKLGLGLGRTRVAIPRAIRKALRFAPAPSLTSTRSTERRARYSADCPQPASCEIDHAPASKAAPRWGPETHRPTPTRRDMAMTASLSVQSLWEIRLTYWSIEKR
jgi:hypothetical protein